MKKTLLLSLLILLAAGALWAQNPADEAYIKAMTVQDNCEKVRLLKEFINQYAGKGSQYENYAYAYLCLIPCPSKSLQESLNYGEKALAASGLDSEVRVSLMVYLANNYVNQGQNLDKARNYGNQLIEIGKAENPRREPTSTSGIK